MKAFGIKLQNISLKKFQNLLKEKELSKSRRLVLEKIDKRFTILENEGINNLEELLDLLKSKSKIENFSRQSSIPVDYLTILKREAGGYQTKAVALQKFPGIEGAIIDKLKKVGIKQSKQFFEQAQSHAQRKLLSKITLVPEKVLLELFKMCDLARIWGVGPVFTRLLLAAEIDSVEQFINMDIPSMYEALMKLNKDKDLNAGHFSQKDLEACVEMSRELE